MSTAAAGLRLSTAHRQSLAWKSRLAWAGYPLLVYFVSRAVGAAVLLYGAARQAQISASSGYHAEDLTAASPPFSEVVANWDGQWYQSIALHGYPNALPTADGAVLQNEWAFFPLFPLLCRAVMAGTGMSFGWAAVALNILVGAIAVCALYRILVARTSVFNARVAVTLLCSFVAAPALQVAYTEALALLLVVLTLWAIATGRYWVSLAPATALSLTRGVLPAMAVVLIVTVAVRAAATRDTSVSWWRPLARGVVVGVVMLGLSMAWPMIAGVVTGVPDAYLRTQDAWPARRDLPAFGGWFASAMTWQPLPQAGFLVALGVMVAAIWLQRRTFGLVLTTWALAYLAYILTMTAPSPSILRYLMLCVVPFWPLLRDPAPSRSTRTALLLPVGIVSLLGVAAQAWWVLTVFTVHQSPLLQAHP